MDNNLVCIYPFLEYQVILSLIKNINSKDKVKKILEEHFKINIETNNLIGKAYDLRNHMRYFILNLPSNCKIERIDNIYKFIGSHTGINHLIMSDKPVSRLDKNNLQFCVLDGKLKILRGNLFYAEINLLEDCHRVSWFNECVSFGFCNHKSSCFKQVGWENGTIGIHIDDGGIFNGSMTPTYNFTEIKKGNTIGVGVIQRKYYYYIFYTVNGKKIWGGKLYSFDEIYLALGLDNSFPIELNIGKEQFKYNLLEEFPNDLWD